ncbi:hypothetical protein ACHAAC_06685 [Aeromicrobium sp. CF4.19]|uniref:hypothetical protein n=1 Tax=Aeromicrobium sp. CF4.19 TaxID=3373082 RepID=UPI003EE53567
MDRYPTAAYLMGAMLKDGIDIDLALRIAGGYDEARDNLDDEKTQQWLTAMLHRLGPGHNSTALAVLASPSDHDATKYEQLARENGWKEGDDAHAPEQK